MAIPAGGVRDPSLRRIQLALAASLVEDGAYSTAVTVWAYREGAQLVGAASRAG